MGFMVGTLFTPGDRVVYEENGTKALCRVNGRRADGNLLFYDLLPLEVEIKKNKKKLRVGCLFTVGVNISWVGRGTSTWSLRPG